MPISHAHKCIFIHIPKTGGTSIETSFNMFHSWKDENLDAMFGLIQPERLQMLGLKSNFLQHLTWQELQLLVPANIIENYFSFAWVRNPWDRMVSVFSKKDPNLLQQAASVGIKLDNIDFEEFIDKIAKIEHAHLRPQHEFILDEDGLPLVDFIGYFERFPEDFHILCERLGVSFDLLYKNSSNHLDYRSYYNTKTRKLVAERYSADISYFSYTF